VTKVLRVPHFWIILAIMACGAVLYYADQIPGIETLVDRAPLGLARYSTHRILSIIPVAYAAFVFRFPGGAITTIFISAALLPRAFLWSTESGEAHAEIVAFMVIGLIVSWLIDRLQRTVQRLQNAQGELKGSLETIESQQQQLVSLYYISTVVYRTLDLDKIAKDALDRILDLTRTNAGWIYLRDDESGDLVLKAHRGMSSHFVETAGRIKPHEGLDGQVATTGTSLRTEVTPNEIGLEAGGATNGVSLYIVPMPSRSGNEGTLAIVQARNGDGDGALLDLLNAAGNAMGIAIEHARLHHIEALFSQQLQFSEERYRGLFENASEAIFVCSSTGRIVSANRACEELTGRTQEELLSLTLHELFSDESQESVINMFAADSTTAALGQTEDLSLVVKDGKHAYVELKVSPLVTSDGVLGLQAILRDVTEERQLRQNMEYYITQITRAQEDERLRISRELHDDTAQLLVGLSRGLDSLTSGKSKLPKTTKEHLERLHALTESALEGVRRFSQDLRPSVLDDLGLIPALEWLAADLEERSDISTSVSIAGASRRLSPETELAIFRIAQEALSNVRKHSQASRVDMSVDFAEDALTLVVTDDGVGFYMPQRASDLVVYGKLGIVGMRERARLVNGTLIVQSDMGAGTVITLRVPE
jgi:PAS domain S-box-containing protein